MERNIPADAKQIADHVLSVTGQALLDGDFDAFKKWFSLPYRVICLDGVCNYDTMDCFRQLFTRISSRYIRISATNLIRIVREVDWITPDRIRCLYETRVIATGNTLYGDPFFCLTELRRDPEDGVWRVVSSAYAMEEGDIRNSILMSCAHVA